MSQSPTTKDAYLVCLHEAGHSCVAIALGLGVEFAEILWGPKTIGAMYYDEATCAKFAAGDYLGSKMTTAFGGPLAEAIHEHGAGMVDPVAFDWDSRNGDITCAREIAEAFTSCRENRDAWLARSSSTAYGHLLASWPSVLGLAAFILANQRAGAAIIRSFFTR